MQEKGHSMEKKLTREEVMKRFLASKEKKRQHIVQLEKDMREEYRKRTGLEAKNFVVL